MVFKLLNMLDVLNYAARSSALWLRIWAGSGVTIFKSAQYAEFFPGQVKLWKNTKLTGCTQAVRLKLSKVIQGSVEKAIFSPATALTSHFFPWGGSSILYEKSVPCEFMWSPVDRIRWFAKVSAATSVRSWVPKECLFFRREKPPHSWYHFNSSNMAFLVAWGISKPSIAAKVGASSMIVRRWITACSRTSGPAIINTGWGPLWGICPWDATENL